LKPPSAVGSVFVPTWYLDLCVSCESVLNWRRYILPREYVMSIRLCLCFTLH
jgi:hypothetical protein